MAIASIPIELETRSKAVRGRPGWSRVRRQGPLLKPSRSALEVYGLDMTAGCAHGCVYCHIKGSSTYPKDDKVLFDPEVASRLKVWLDKLDELPRQVVLSPQSDPLPPLREVRAATLKVTRLLLERNIDVLLMTRGRLSSEIVDLLADHPERARVAIGLTTLDRKLSRTLEPWAAPPWKRLQGVRALLNAGVPVEIRLEPLISGVTDTRENLKPLFAAIARTGARRVVAHYLFLVNEITNSLADALTTLECGEEVLDVYSDGPSFMLGSIGMTRHLPLEERRAGLARLTAWGAEHSLIVETGATQNPDFRRADPSSRPRVDLPILPLPT